jgi:hypothetical protein
MTSAKQSISSGATNFVTYADTRSRYSNGSKTEIQALHGTETAGSERKPSCSSSRSLPPSFLESSLEVDWRSW